MPRKLRRGGQPGNTNALRHGWRLLWSRGVLRPEDAWVKKPIAETMCAFAGDLPDLSAREREVVETVATAKGCELLISQALQETGLVQVTEGRIHVAQAHEALARFMKLKLDALRLLPPGRRAKAVVSLDQYVKEKYGRQDTTDSNGKPTNADET